MRTVRYSRYEGPVNEPLTEEFLERLAGELLESGFNRSPFAPDPDAGSSFEELLRAIAATLAAEGLLPDGLDSEAGQADDWQATRLGRLALRVAEQLGESGFLAFGPPAGAEPDSAPLTFELTPRAVAVLGGFALKELTGLERPQLPGAHRTRYYGSGVEASSASRPWQFGDSLSLAAADTLREAARHGLQDDGRIRIGAADLRVHEAELSSRAATVLLLDCSHSMILYGEDRFTPAKKVALALARLIRSHYRGDSLKFVLFHDGAEEVSLEQLAAVRVGPFHTNTAGGLRVARRLLARETAGSRQIMMITDGKPTAVTLPDGRVYRNAYGQDPLVMRETMREVFACRRLGIPVNTFMLAREPALVAFVTKVAQLTGGQAFAAEAAGLGRLVLREFSDLRRS